MSVCRELMDAVSSHQKKSRMFCPITVKPTCHPKEKLFRVHVDGRKRVIFLSCPKCDRLISCIRIKGRLNKGMKLEK